MEAGLFACLTNRPSSDHRLTGHTSGIAYYLFTGIGVWIEGIGKTDHILRFSLAKLLQLR